MEFNRENCNYLRSAIHGVISCVPIYSTRSRVWPKMSLNCAGRQSDRCKIGVHCYNGNEKWECINRRRVCASIVTVLCGLRHKVDWQFHDLFWYDLDELNRMHYANGRNGDGAWEIKANHPPFVYDLFSSIFWSDPFRNSLANERIPLNSYM